MPRNMQIWTASLPNSRDSGSSVKGGGRLFDGFERRRQFLSSTRVAICILKKLYPQTRHRSISQPAYKSQVLAPSLKV